jgi:hypothetical protein
MEEILASIRRIISDDKKEQRSEPDEEPAPARAGGMSTRLRPAEHDDMAWPGEPAEESRFAEGPVAKSDALAAADAEAPGRIGFELEESRTKAPSVGLAVRGEPEAASDEEAVGRFAEPAAGYEALAVPAPMAGLRARSEEELDAAFALRRGVGAGPRRDDDLKAEETTAMEEPTAVEGPAAMEQPAAVEGPAAMEEPAAIEEAAPIEEESRLISSRTDASVASAFASLEKFVLSTHSRTLEDLVSEMLRPLLKAWLDVNLPPLVERLVREEIERVSRGRR